MTTEQIKQRLQAPAFIDAAKALEMIQRTPQQRDQYEKRLKAQRDYRATIEQARIEGEAKGEARGRAIGEARGVLIGQITILSRLFGNEIDSLENHSVDELDAMVTELQRQLRERDV